MLRTNYLLGNLFVALEMAMLSNLPCMAEPSGDFAVPGSEPVGVSLQDGIRLSHTRAAHLEFKNAVTNAKSFCQEYLRDHPGERKVAVVLDIDETLIDNREELAKKDKITLQDWESWIEEARAPVIPTMASFAKWARRQGFAIFLVTARHEHLRAATIVNLVNDRVNYDGLFMREDNDYGPAEVSKTKAREQIESLGFKIVVNVGDQESDLVGGHALDCEKVPNKMYFIP